MKLVILVAVVSIAWRMMLGRWPWDYLRAPPTRAQAVFRARKLLGVGSEASHAEIRAAHRRLSTLVHPDRGGSDQRQQELNAARDLLLDELPYESSHNKD